MRNKLNILVVDHSGLFRSMLTNVLNQHCCYTNTSCSTGEEAFALLKTGHYDLICASYHLPDMDGATFTKNVRHLQNCQNTRVILFTSENNQTLLKKAYLAGATDIFSKQQFSQFECYLKRLAADAANAIIGQVLLVEDSPSQLYWMESLLSQKGLEVDTFSNAEEALNAFRKNYYDLVITDIVLEGAMSGLSLVREIRKDPSEKGSIPVFAISAYDDISRRIELYHVGVNDYMTKPIIAEELLYRLANLIRSHRILNELNVERKHLQEIALLDPVTGLYNRNAFDQFAHRELAAAERNHYPISLAILDIDHFKRINDTYGHDTGDKVLADIGLWFRNSIRKGDLVFRWGGEEFVIILTNCTPEQALKALEKHRIRLNKRKYADLPLTVSIGVSGIDANEKTTIRQLFKQADEAVYNAKILGRNQACLFLKT